MPASHGFLANLALVLGVAAATTIVFQRLRQPVVLGYLLAGLLIGPYVPVPLVADSATIRALSELGVILLMFSIGLEFSVRRLLRVGGRAAGTAAIEIGVMLWAGYAVGRLAGWSARESLYLGAIVAISSTTIVGKVFAERRVEGPVRELVFAVLVVEDLVAVLLLVLLGALGSGRGLSPGALPLAAGRLLLFLVVAVVLGLLLVPRAIRLVLGLGRSETTLITAVALCFGGALLTRAIGYSEALGAFLAGSLVAESGGEQAVGRLVAPVRDLLVAIFFVAVGMQIDPVEVARHAGLIVLVAAVVVVGKVLGVTTGAFLTGNGVHGSLQAGLSLAQIGELSFVIAGLGLSLGETRPFLYPVAVAVSALTMLLSPWLIRASPATSKLVERMLPRPLETFASLYTDWIQRLRGGGRVRRRSRLRRLVRALIIDSVLLGTLAVSAALLRARIALLLGEHLHLGPPTASALVAAATVVLALPLGIGLVKNARLLGLSAAEELLPLGPAGQMDLARAPRRTLAIALQSLSLLVVLLPLLAVTQPFLPLIEGALVLVVLVAILVVAVWHSSSDLQGHVRAGAELVAEVLAAQAKSGGPGEGASLEGLEAALPGVGPAVIVEIKAGSPAVGRSLAELRLWGETGATVLVIRRTEGTAVLPRGGERLRAGDRVALVGSREAMAAAKALLEPPGA